MSVSYDRVMDVRRGFAQDVSKRWAEDRVVVFSNAKRKVFEHVQQTALMSPTLSHVSHDNMREDPPPLSLDVTGEKCDLAPC